MKIDLTGQKFHRLQVVQKSEEQSTEKGCTPFAQKLIAREQDTAGEDLFQKSGDHCNGNQGDQKAGLLDGGDGFLNRVGEKQAHQIGQQAHDGLNGNAERKDDKGIFPAQRVQSQGLFHIFFCDDKI